MTAVETQSVPEPASLWRRLAAGVYDLLPLAALWMIAGAAWVGVQGAAVAPGDPAFRAWLLAVALAYYGWSWRGGQTLGMRPWRIRVVTRDGMRLGWGAIALRFAVALVGIACLGMGIWWALLDQRSRTWHDLAAGTEVVRV